MGNPIKEHASPKKRRKLRRTKDEIEEDIIRYQELLKHDKELENDIPPRKMKSRRIVKREEEEFGAFDNAIPTNRRNRSTGDKCKETRPNSNSNEKTITDLIETVTREVFKINKPKYKFAKVPFKKPSPLKYLHQDLPPSINQEIKSFESKVLVENSYQDLIKMIKNDIENEEVDGKRYNNIDFGMKLNLLEKNLSFEKDRFEIYDNEEKSKVEKLLKPHDVYRSRGLFSEDIDVFFKHLYNPDSFRNDTTTKDQLKRSIPLA